MRRSKRSGSIGIRALLWVAGVAIVLFALLVVPFALVRNASVRDRLLDFSLRRDLLLPEWTMRIDSVRRLDPTGIEFRGIHLIHREASGDRPFASLGTLKVHWDPRHLLRRRLWAESIVLDSLAVRADVPPPRFRQAPEGKGKGTGTVELPWLRLGSFELTRVSVANAAGPIATGSIAMRRLEHRQGSIRGAIDEASFFYHPDSISVRLSGGEIDGTLTEQLRLRGMEISMPGLISRLDGEATLPGKEGDALGLAGVWDFERLTPAEVPLLRRLRVPFAPGDTLRGTLRAELHPPLLSAAVAMKGTLFGGPLGRFDLEADRAGDTLTVGRLILQHRAGNIDGWGTVRFDGPSLRGTIRIEAVDLGDPSLAAWLSGTPHTRIDGDLRGEALLRKGEEAIEASGEIGRIDVQGTPLGPARLEGRLAGRLLTIDSLSVGPGGRALRGEGFFAIDTRKLGGRAELDSLSLDRTLAPFIPVPIGGSLRGRIEVEGTVDAPAVRGWVDAEEFRVLDIRARHVRGDSLSGPLVPIGLGGWVRAEGLELYGARIDSADFRVAWNRTLHVAARASVDSLTARASVVILPQEPGSLAVESLSLHPGSLPPWNAAGRARIGWKQGTTRIEGVDLESENGTIRGRMDVGKGGSPLLGAVRIENFDLDLIRHLLGLPDSSLAGHVEVTAAIGGSAKDPAGRARVEARDLVLARWPVGNLNALATLQQGGALRVDTLLAGEGRGRGRLRATDLAVSPPVPLPEFLAGLRDPASLLLRRTGVAGRISIDSLSVGRIVKTGLETVPGGGRTLLVEPADPMSGRIRTVRAGQEQAAALASSAVRGEIHLDLDLSGSAATPRLRGVGDVRNLRIYDARADSLLFAVSYAPQSLTLDSLVWHQGSQVDRATGRMPLVLSLSPGATKVPMERPIEFDAELPDIDLAILGLISKDIQEPEGTLSGTISLRGTPKKIWPEGSLQVQGGAIRIPKREERIYAIDGSLALDSTGVRIQSLQGKIGKEGTATVSGWWRDLAHFDLQGKVRQATFYETGLYHVNADADLDAFPVTTPEGSYPLIVGTVNVTEGALVGDLAKQPLPPAGAVVRPSPWRAEIDVNAPGNLRMSTAIASVELGEGEDIHVSFQDPVINVSGRIQVLGGRYRVFNNVFTITSGTVEFRDTGRLPEPILDIYAQTSVADPSLADRAQSVLVKIHVTGPVLALNIEFSSEPERSQSEIVELLSLGRLADPTTGSFGAKDPSRQYLFTEVVSQIESQLSQLSGMFESVQIIPGATPGEAWKVSLRRTLAPQVSVAYSRELTGTASQEANIRYNLRGQLYLNADVQRTMTGATPTDLYSLDLRLRFEY